MPGFTLPELHRFIVHAKAATYVSSGQKLLPYRLSAHDLQSFNGDRAQSPTSWGVTAA